MTIQQETNIGLRNTTVAVIGMGKIGLPLSAQYADNGWNVIGVDIMQSVVDILNEGRVHFDEEPFLAEKIATAHEKGLFRATTSYKEAIKEAGVVIVIVPLMLQPDNTVDYRIIDSATASLAPHLQPGTLVIYETTLPVGDTRHRFGPQISELSGLSMSKSNGFWLAFSPERVYSGRIFQDLERYPKLVGGVDPISGELAAIFYKKVLNAEVWNLTNSESAEFAKLAETTYRDVNIALANQFAAYADKVGADITEVIRGANSQPFSHIHQPGIGVGGHCIPVYPHFLLSRDSELTLIAESRRINNSQTTKAIEAILDRCGTSPEGAVLVLGLTYRSQVKELAYSRATALIRELKERGIKVYAFDPLMTAAEVRLLGAEPYDWNSANESWAIITQTDDPIFSKMNLELFENLRIFYDGRNSFSELPLPAGVIYKGVGKSN